MFLHNVNNTELNVKQNIYTGMEIPSWHAYKTARMTMYWKIT